MSWEQSEADDGKVACYRGLLSLARSQRRTGPLFFCPFFFIFFLLISWRAGWFTVLMTVIMTGKHGWKMTTGVVNRT